jgi:hypothetical protein
MLDFTPLGPYESGHRFKTDYEWALAGAALKVDVCMTISRVGGQRVPRITEHFSNHPPPSELMRLSNSSRSPATPSKQAWMMTGSAVASAHLAHLTAAGYRVTCSPSPTLPLPRVTPSVVNEPAAHITVRPCQAITAIQFGYYENSGTVSLSTGRPSRVPCRRNVRAPLSTTTRVLAICLFTRAYRCIKLL